MIDQRHLLYRERVNLGGYYTKPELVTLVYQLVRENVGDYRDHILLDTSCGYGSFIRDKRWNNKRIGADIDGSAIKRAASLSPDVRFVCKNALNNVAREGYQLSPADKIIIVGNPPYNDTTSIARNRVKRSFEDVDPSLKTRDLGISFLLSYGKLRADYICVLHPLSYLIKKANFAALKSFALNYTLIDSVIVSSAEFSQTSKVTEFPIIVALYKRDRSGMDYEFIREREFKTKEGKNFKLADFDPISNYLTKYPNQKRVDPKEAIAKFWTMRDINALKRSRTFVTNTTANTIFVTRELFEYYCYVDIFKRFIRSVPYYFGNCDVMIDNDAFLKLKDDFKALSIERHSHLKSIVDSAPKGRSSLEKIEAYFRELLGEHHVH